MTWAGPPPSAPLAAARWPHSPVRAPPGPCSAGRSTWTSWWPRRRGRAGRGRRHRPGAETVVDFPMEFRRINGLPPYVFATINDLKLSSRRAGRDVIDLGFGNPDLPSPDVAVNKLAEAAHNPRNHRYSASRGIPKLRSAVANLYQRKFGIELDPESEVVTTIGAKEGFSHLMWVLVGPGDTALVPSPSYPDPHLGASLRRRRRAPGAPERTARGHGRRRARPRRHVLRGTDARVGGVLAQAPSDRALVPAQPDDSLCRPLVHGTPRRIRTRARSRARPRLRLRGPRVRRLRAPVDPPGARGQGGRRRDLHDDQVVLHGRLARRLRRRERRDRPGPHQAQDLPRLRHLPADSDRGHRGHERGARLPEGDQPDLPVAARHRCATA